MARLTNNLYGVTESLPTIPKIAHIPKTCPRLKSTKIKCHDRNLEEFHDANDNQISSLGFSSATRRSVTSSLASIALFAQFGVKTAFAEEDNGLWLTGPLPGLPPVDNKIANEETGTRTFLKKGIYIANIGTKGSAYRLRKYAFDLMAMGDLIGQDAWNYIRRYLKLKGTVMYYDFDKVISAAPVSDKQPLMNLANRLFDNFEKLQDAVKMKDLPLTESCYQDTTTVLQEVMDRMA